VVPSPAIPCAILTGVPEIFSDAGSNGTAKSDPARDSRRCPVGAYRAIEAF